MSTHLRTSFPYSGPQDPSRKDRLPYRSHDRDPDLEPHVLFTFPSCGPDLFPTTRTRPESLDNSQHTSSLSQDVHRTVLVLSFRPPPATGGTRLHRRGVKGLPVHLHAYQVDQPTPCATHGPRRGPDGLVRNTNRVDVHLRVASHGGPHGTTPLIPVSRRQGVRPDSSQSLLRKPLTGSEVSLTGAGRGTDPNRRDRDPGTNSRTRGGSTRPEPFVDEVRSRASSIVEATVKVSHRSPVRSWVKCLLLWLAPRLLNVHVVEVPVPTNTLQDTKGHLRTERRNLVEMTVFCTAPSRVGSSSRHRHPLGPGRGQVSRDRTSEGSTLSR